MKKRQMKKLARKAVRELEQMETAKPLSSSKIQKATFEYINAVMWNYPEPKVYRDFWKAFNKLEVKQNA